MRVRVLLLLQVTIRVLGGLLSAYEATEHPTLLSKADELGRALFYAFLTPHGLPYGTLNLKTGGRYNPTWSRGASTIAEVATLQLEFRVLARHTGRSAYDSRKALTHTQCPPPPQCVCALGALSMPLSDTAAVVQ